MSAAMQQARDVIAEALWHAPDDSLSGEPWAYVRPDIRALYLRDADAILAALESVLAAHDRQVQAEALRDVDAALDRLCWGDYFAADGTVEYGAGLRPVGGTGRTTGLRDWLRARADEIEAGE